MNFFKRITLVLLTLMPMEAVAQIRAAGILSSLTAGGVQVEFESSERAYHSVTAGVNVDRHFKMVDSPGFFIGYDYCFTVLSHSSGPGTFSFLCGPGVQTGWLDNYGAKYRNGFVLAIDACLAVEYEFFKRFAIGLRTSPTLGFHIQKTLEYPSMTIYKAGLVQGGVPQMTVKYCFL